MKFLFTSYISTPEFSHPEKWLKRINGYVGVLEQLAKFHEVISIERINYEGRIQRNGVLYQFINFGKQKIWFPWRMHQFIKNQQPDVVIVHGLHFPLQVLQLRQMIVRKTIIIAQHHAEKPASGVKKYFQQLADRSINAYLFASGELGMDWVQKQNLTNPKKIYEVMEASSGFFRINQQEAKLRTNVEGHPVYLWVGRLDKNKDPLIVVQGFLQFQQNNPAARLYMIYHTTELLAAIKALLASKNKSSQAVLLIGKVAHHDMLYWFNSADFIIAGSHYEGSGIAVCEAMSCGCVPILTAIPSFKKMTGHGKCGLLYEAGNADDLLKVLNQTPEMDIEKERHKVLVQFKNELSFEAIAKKIEAVVRDCS